MLRKRIVGARLVLARYLNKATFELISNASREDEFRPYNVFQFIEIKSNSAVERRLVRRSNDFSR